jgi:hypothetical protein
MERKKYMGMTMSEASPLACLTRALTHVHAEREPSFTMQLALPRRRDRPATGSRSQGNSPERKEEAPRPRFTRRCAARARPQQGVDAMA